MRSVPTPADDVKPTKQYDMGGSPSAPPITGVTTKAAEEERGSSDRSRSKTPANDSSSGLSVQERTDSTHRAALARCMGAGTVLLPLFSVFDILVTSTLYTSARLPVIFGWRAFAEGCAIIAFWVARSPTSSMRAVKVTHFIGLVLVGFGLSAMAVETGGPTSLYVHGLAIILMVRSGTVPAAWKQTARIGSAVALTYPVVFLALYLIDPAAHAAWLTKREIGLWLSQYALMCAAIGCGVYASHQTWTAMVQLYEARKLGRYRLEALIGRGGQNEVWLARDTSLGRNVALKILHASAASPQNLALFRREAHLASQLTSPNAVRIFDFGASDDGIYYLAMEYLDGADLGALVKGHGPMSPERVVHFAVQACQSLAEAHEKGLVHRDVKPSNLFAIRTVDARDTLKLVDFGIALSLEEDREQLTRTGMVRGTLAYLAPECCRGDVATSAADLYGLGATLYQLLTGTAPFRGSDPEVVAGHLDRKPEQLSKRLGKPIPEDLEKVVLRCLEKDPRHRYTSARSLRDALLACACAEKWTSENATRFWTREREAALAQWQTATIL